MPNASYLRGRLAEYKVQTELEALGFTTIRAAGSKGKTDILAWDLYTYKHIQVKTFQSKKPPAYTEDILQLLNIVMPPNGRRELWVKQAGGRGWFARYAIYFAFNTDGYVLVDIEAEYNRPVVASTPDTPSEKRAG